MTEYFPYTCPDCGSTRNAADVAKELPREVFTQQIRPLVGRLRRRRLAGPGRPTLVRCPGCDDEMTTPELRDHRVACVRKRLRALQQTGYKVWLEPKDPDPYPDFRIERTDDEYAYFDKLSTPQTAIPVELRKIAEIAVDAVNKVVRIRLFGHLSWDSRSTLWSFLPSQFGRPTITA
jgi:hypothetical protein